MGDTETTDELLPVERAVKFTGPDTIEGLAIPFGYDTDDETFTPKTDLCLDWFGKSGRPLLYDHGLDKPGPAVIGRQIDFEERPDGIWVKSQLDKNRRYRKAVDALVEARGLGYSTGAMAHLAQKNKRGEITRWPWIETSLTPYPAHPDTMVHYVKSADALAHLAEVDIEVPEPLKAALAALDEWAGSRDEALVPEPLADRLDRVSVELAGLQTHAREYVDMRTKAGRVLSAQTRERLLRNRTALREFLDDLDGLLSEADADKAAKSADLFDMWLSTEERLARLDAIPITPRTNQ